MHLPEKACSSTTYRIVFNRPYLTGLEIGYIQDAVACGKLSGNGKYTQLCHRWMEKRYGFGKCLLTSSCTNALEMAALLLNIQPGDEVIMPSYTFVSTANAFVLRGARIVFADSASDHPNMDVNQLPALLTPRTKAIVVVHYGGVANDMQAILQLAQTHGLAVVEDAAQAIDSYYSTPQAVRPLGSIGQLAAFSFHETKNIMAGEGGMLVVNDERLYERAEILWEKGTNRTAFFRGQVSRYEWVDVGSSFLPSEITAAFLYAQLQHIDNIQQRRKMLWQYYYEQLRPLQDAGYIALPYIPPYATNNAHLFYILCHNADERYRLTEHLRQQGIMAVHHYLPLHTSPFYYKWHDGRLLPNCQRFANCLLRLPLYYELSHEAQQEVIDSIKAFFA